MPGTIPGDYEQPLVSRTGTQLTASLPPGAITEPGVAYAYQWYRDDAAIVGATAATYTLTAVDYTKLITVRVIVSKPNYTSVVLLSVPQSYLALAPARLAMQGAGRGPHVWPRTGSVRVG